MRWSRSLTASVGAISPAAGAQFRGPAAIGLDPLPLEPVAQGFGREAVVAVVDGDTLAQLFRNARDLTELERELDVAPCDSGIAQVEPPGKRVERLHLL